MADRHPSLPGFLRPVDPDFLRRFAELAEAIRDRCTDPDPETEEDEWPTTDPQT